MRSLSLMMVLALCFSAATACGGKKKAPTAAADARAPQNTTAMQLSEPAMKALFFDSDYTSCDAHFVAQTFNFEYSQSKAYIGQKIAWGTTDLLDGYLREARQRGQTDPKFRCQFYQSDFTYDDASALADMWGTDVGEAKVRIEDKILWGNEAYVRDELLPEARALRGGGAHVLHDAMDPDYAYGEDGDPNLAEPAYDGCHAQMLVGTYFGQTTAETKSLIEYKVANGWTDVIEDELKQVRGRHQAQGTTPCHFYQTRFTPDDAQALATLWGENLSQAKARVESKYVWGNEWLIHEELERARNSR